MFELSSSNSFGVVASEVILKEDVVGAEVQEDGTLHALCFVCILIWVFPSFPFSFFCITVDSITYCVL
jgi:hypothetical protein